MGLVDVAISPEKCEGISTSSNRAIRKWVDAGEIYRATATNTAIALNTRLSLIKP
jgi:hypothetical protein